MNTLLNYPKTIPNVQSVEGDIIDISNQNTHQIELVTGIP